VLISHERRFIFIKTRKTAGSSIEQFLAPLTGADGVVTPPTDGDRNHRERFSLTRELSNAPDHHDMRIGMRQWRRRVAYNQHMPAWRVRERIGHERWNSYFTFCFERDPWDKLVSFYWWRTREDPNPPDFETFCRTTPDLSAWPLYAIDDQVGVDFVGRYENLHDDLQYVLDRVGLDVPIDLPREKSGYRTAEPQFSPELDRWVSQTFRREIEAFGYDDRSVSGHV
jgi:hypothetical protein